jgi:hypothetical protein
MALASLPPIDDPHMGADAAGIALPAFSVILDASCEELVRVAVTFDSCFKILQSMQFAIDAYLPKKILSFY